MWVRCLIAGVVAFALGLASVPAQAQTFVTVLTGGTAGVYYPLGVALSKIFAEKVQNVRPTVQATKASVENLNLLQQGRGEVAFTLGDSLALAWAGGGGGLPHQASQTARHERDLSELHPDRRRQG